MNPTRCLIALACTLAAAAVTALPPVEPAARTERELPLGRAAERDLKAIYLRCASEANKRLLFFDEAVGCSSASELLLQRVFGGDLDALLAWWRQHRDEPLTEQPAPAGQNLRPAAGRSSGT